MNPDKRMRLCSGSRTRKTATYAFRFFVLLVFLALANPLAADSADLSEHGSTFIWLSDIHWDPTADPSLVKTLADADVSQWESILESTHPAKLSGYGDDANWPLFHSALSAAHRVAGTARFSVVTGDIFPHHFREKFERAANTDSEASFQSFARKTFDFVAMQLRRLTPARLVLYTPGNNDNDCDDYATQLSGSFLSATIPAVSQLLNSHDRKVRRDWLLYGSYDRPHPTLPHTRVIALNTVVLSAKYRDACGAKGSGSPGDAVLDWLGEKLKEASAHREVVWIVTHIPPGIDGFATVKAQQEGDTSAVVPLWQPRFQTRFTNLLSEYPHTVTVILAAHIHSDAFRLLQNGVALLTPSVSPNIRQNPAFRVVEISRNGLVLDQETYFLANLPSAVEGASPDWQLEYRFDQAWNVPLLDSPTLLQLYSRIEQSPAMQLRWMKQYTVSKPGATAGNTTFWAHFCASGYPEAQAFENCLSRHEEHPK